MDTQNKNLLQFTFHETAQPVHVEMIHEQPWFLAKELCSILELNDTNKALQALDQDETLTRKVFVSGQNRDMRFVNESGMYALIFRSNKPAAKTFRKWVTSEVLPSIRKTGSYSKSYRTACHTSTGYVAKGFYSNYIDYRNVLCNFIDYRNKQLKALEYQDSTWYAISSFFKCIGTTTKVTQACRNLKTAGVPLQSFWLFGETTPAIFTTSQGLELLAQSSRTIRHDVFNIELPFPRTLPRQLAVGATNNLKAV